MADFVCQCEQLSDLPSHAWERNMDVVELFSGDAELTGAFSFLLMNSSKMDHVNIKNQIAYQMPTYNENWHLIGIQK